MKSKPFFSIIIPTLNEEKYLPQLLRCLKKQTYKNFEVLVVDSRSKDKTHQVVQSFQKKIPLLKLIKSAKRGVSRQRNLGAKNAHGQYLLFMDADVVFDKETLGKIYQYLLKNKSSLFSAKSKFPNIKIKYRIISFFWILLSFYVQKFKRNIGIGAFIGITKTAFWQTKGFNEKIVLSEEHNLIKEVRKLGGRIDFIKSVTIILSPRRFEKEGIIKSLLKYLYFILYEHLKGPLYHSPLNYEMGGHHYD
ncbi:MAG TPA: glycosyltransferase [Candidatus Bathyarchaeia archaeon]|nr:glycosyltransferase [Candidatus Bathyarchaeia archaeon]